jgi:hypothetical protein
MFGPVWMWIAGAGWTAKAVVDKLRQPPTAGAPGAPGARPTTAQVGAPPAAGPQPPPVTYRPDAKWDKNMDERTERAVIRAIELRNPTQLRGFAASIDENVPPVHRARNHHPVAAFVMRGWAQQIENEARVARAAQAAPTAPAPAPEANHLQTNSPTSIVAPMNGAAKPATAAVVAEPEKRAES